MKQFFILVLLLPFIFCANIKLPTVVSNQIVSFALFNYDNLIADGYEDEKPYIQQLSSLLSKATNIKEDIYYQMLNSKEFKEEDIPIKYLLLLSKFTLKVSNCILIDE